jgi:hypothetical protein
MQSGRSTTELHPPHVLLGTPQQNIIHITFKFYRFLNSIVTLERDKPQALTIEKDPEQLHVYMIRLTCQIPPKPAYH